MGGSECGRERASVQLIRMAGETVEFAEKVAVMAVDRLAPVILQVPPTPDKTGAGVKGDAAQPAWPELFDILRAKLNIVNANLATIESTLNQAEV